MTLNEMKEEFRNLLAPTDCRFRTDIQALEIGNLGKILRSNYINKLKSRWKNSKIKILLTNK